MPSAHLTQQQQQQQCAQRPPFLFDEIDSASLTLTIRVRSNCRLMRSSYIFAHSTPGRLHLTWMGIAMHDMGSLGHTLQVDHPRDWANLALYLDVDGGGHPVLRCW